MVVFVWVALMSVIGTYAERRVAGYMQGRLGPNRVGWFGVLQPIADGIKLLGKEDLIPAGAAKWLFRLAPILVFCGVLIPYAALPFSPRLVVSDMAVAIYYILAFEALEVVGVLMAGWAPNSKWSLYGGMRLAAQMLSYEIPMGLALVVIVLFAGSLNFQQIVAWQQTPMMGIEDPNILGWGIFRSPACFVAFFIFFIGGLASAKRAPFDLPEAESELVAGYHTEYSGMRFAFFFMAEYGAMYLVSALTAILFLGGWYGPLPLPEGISPASLVELWNTNTAGQESFWSACQAFISAPVVLTTAGAELIGFINLAGKALILFFTMIWIRWTLPRIRIDQVMHLCLKVLLPLSMIAALGAAIQIVIMN
ncbi:MAG: NADH-quinone oxidoreductase subunit H [Deltaproteobacteria bacterium]|nr:NADH-quinone oxidoreductase subunit H [Deltaproteobacteria bacterium]